MRDNKLLMKTCSPVPAATPPLSEHDVEHLLGHIEGWDVVDGRLEKSFQFEDHYQAVAFVNAVAWISHREDHHPDLVLGYNTCTVSYSTHSIGGLSENDFICAAKVNALVGD